MKTFPLTILMFIAIFTIKSSNSGTIKAPLNIISLHDLTPDERETLAKLDEKFQRSKRSGSPDVLSSLKYLLAQGAKAKLKLLGRASAGAISSVAAGSSGSSSGSGSKNYGHSIPDYTYHPNTYADTGGYEKIGDNLTLLTQIKRSDHISPRGDKWSMKKDILNTLLQAVKAIKGGVLAVKGLLIKGGGWLLVGGGKLVKTKGEAITNLGKKIARTAFRSMHPDHSSEVHEGGSYGHYHPSDIEYGPPPPSGPGYHDHFHHHYPDKANSGLESGILILKKIPSAGKKPTEHNLYGSETHHQPPAAVPYHGEDDTSNVGTILGKFLSAASSLNPDSPAPFTDYKETEIQPQEHVENESGGAGHAVQASEENHGGYVSNYEYFDPYFK